MADCYEPVTDWTAPSQAQLERVIGFIADEVARGAVAAASCGAGYRRTGTALAAPWSYVITLVGVCLDDGPGCQDLSQSWTQDPFGIDRRWQTAPLAT